MTACNTIRILAEYQPHQQSGRDYGRDLRPLPQTVTRPIINRTTGLRTEAHKKDIGHSEGREKVPSKDRVCEVVHKPWLNRGWIQTKLEHQSGVVRHRPREIYQRDDSEKNHKRGGAGLVPGRHSEPPTRDAL